MNADSFDLYIITNRSDNLSPSIELQSIMVDCLSYFMDHLSLYFLLYSKLQRDFYVSLA